MGWLKLLFGTEAPILREPDFQFLLLASLLPVLGAALVSPVLDSLIDPYGATSATIGLFISVFVAPSIVIIPIAGVLSDRYGRKLVLVVSLVIFGLTGTLVAFTTDFQLALALRFFQGVGWAGLTPVIVTCIGDLYEGEKETTGQGIRFMAGGVSGGTFPLLAGVLVAFAWQYPFLLYALAIPVAGILYVWFNEPTAATPSERTDGGDPVSYVRALVRLTRQRRVRSLVAARSLMSSVWFGFLTYNSIIVVRLLDGTPVQAGMLAAVGFFMFALAASQAGRITSRFRSRLYPLLAANVGFGAGFVIVLFAPGILVATVGISVTAIGFGVMGALYRSIITGLAPPSLRGGLVSLSEAGGRLTITVTPLVMGAVIAVASPEIGFVPALRLAGIGIAVVGGGGGVVCLLLASVSPPVSVE